MLRPQICFCCFGCRHWGCEDKIGWRTTDDTLEGSGVLVPKGIGELCHSCSCTQKQDFVVNMHVNRSPVQLTKHRSDIIWPLCLSDNSCSSVLDSLLFQQLVLWHGICMFPSYHFLPLHPLLSKGQHGIFYIEICMHNAHDPSKYKDYVDGNVNVQLMRNQKRIVLPTDMKSNRCVDPTMCLTDLSKCSLDYSCAISPASSASKSSLKNERKRFLTIG